MAAPNLPNPERDSLIRADYEAGLSSPVLGRKWGCCPGAIRAAVRRAGGQSRTISESIRGRRFPHRSCTLNEAAFDDVLSNPVAAYFAGLLFADGCIGTKKGGQSTVSLGLSGDGDTLVYALRDFLGSSHKVRVEVPEGGYATQERKTSLAVASDRLVQALSHYGLTPRKSMTATVPDSMLFNRDWWRGVIDGDGWVAISAKGVPIIGVVGTRETCEAFMTFVRTITPSKARATPLNSIWQSKAGDSNAYRVALAVYANCQLALPRKLATAQEIIALGVGKGWPTDAQSKTRTGPKPRGN